MKLIVLAIIVIPIVLLIGKGDSSPIKDVEHHLGQDSAVYYGTKDYGYGTKDMKKFFTVMKIVLRVFGKSRSAMTFGNFYTYLS